ncbi:hypothetical protein DS487_16940 [Salmonella enterica subsp. enterica]|nr:hypothetical protein [Salmonella enterica subsp. enterica serovar Hvittingfoss]
MYRRKFSSGPFGVLLAFSVLAAPLMAQAAEKDELALALRQLDQVQSALERAKTVAAQNTDDDRFFFDYGQATRDLITVRQGIETYLQPSRAQPRAPGALVGQYRKETP